VVFVAFFILFIYFFFSSVNGTEEETEMAANCLWLVTNSKPCPNCKSPIQKNEGCNHMKCSKVRSHCDVDELFATSCYFMRGFLLVKRLLERIQ
jgi:hypothetical protein